jgi:phospholipase C
MPSDPRDHRGQPPASPPAAQPPAAQPPVVRDHTGDGPVVRDHSGGGPVVRDHRGGPPVRPPPPPTGQPGFGDTVRDHRTSAIQHVFVLMLENRSFDHLLGFSGITGTDARTLQPTRVDGLTGTESNQAQGRTFTVSTGPRDVLGSGPRHNFVDVLEQLCGDGVAYPAGGAYPPIHCSGYASSYAKEVGLDAAGEVMKCFSPDQLPVLHALAREFVVCDRWFSSMPGPTEPNRMFAHAATSGEFDDSPTKSEILESLLLPASGIDFKRGTIYRRLDEKGVKYRIYADDHFPNAAELRDISILSIHEFEDFAGDLKKGGFDAGYVFIEPSYDALDGFDDGNSQHPSGSVAAGERFIKAVYEAIRGSPLWESSMLIITWDEHGGFYDHVPPPAAQPTGSRGRDHGFTFGQLGPRVPAVVVSPLVPRNLIEHRLLDHCAIPATVERVFKLDTMGGRDALGNGLNHLATLSTPRTDAPLTLPSASVARLATPRRGLSEAVLRNPDRLVSDDRHGNVAALVRSAVALHLKVAPPAEHQAIVARAAQLQTRADVLAYLKEVDQLVAPARGLQLRALEHAGAAVLTTPPAAHP